MLDLEKSGSPVMVEPRNKLQFLLNIQMEIMKELK